MLMATVVLAVFSLALAVWAIRPLHESMYVGTDWTPTLLVPPEPSQDVYQEVTCNSLLSDAGPHGALPSLTPQPADKPPLAYPREPCTFVHSDARKTFAIDVVLVLAAFGTLAYLARRNVRQREAILR
jgi:hypothetical protein